jgi:hypothetical protein
MSVVRVSIKTLPLQKNVVCKFEKRMTVAVKACVGEGEEKRSRRSAVDDTASKRQRILTGVTDHIRQAV